MFSAILNWLTSGIRARVHQAACLGLHDAVAEALDAEPPPEVAAALERIQARLALPRPADVPALANGHAEEAAPVKGRRR